jgi:hypothetical protein
MTGERTHEHPGQPSIDFVGQDLRDRRRIGHGRAALH